MNIRKTECVYSDGNNCLTFYTNKIFNSNENEFIIEYIFELDNTFGNVIVTSWSNVYSAWNNIKHLTERFDFDESTIFYELKVSECD